MGRKKRFHYSEGYKKLFFRIKRLQAFSKKQIHYFLDEELLIKNAIFNHYNTSEIEAKWLEEHLLAWSIRPGFYPDVCPDIKKSVNIIKSVMNRKTFNRKKLFILPPLKYKNAKK